MLENIRKIYLNIVAAVATHSFKTFDNYVQFWSTGLEFISS